jgi:3-hydroxyacyl-CoA dehydrogenase
MFSFDNSSDPKSITSRALDNVGAMVAWKRHEADLMANLPGSTGISPGGTGYLPVRPIRSVGIIGAGVMGAEIAAAYIKHVLPVTIFDTKPDALATIADRTAVELAAGTDNGDARLLVAGLLNPTDDLTQAAKNDLIIESIPEKLSIKQDLYGRLQKYLAPDAILVSNTSTITIGKLAERMQYPERFCGLHFFHPVKQRPLVEIIRHRKTSDETVAALAAHAKAIDKLPIIVADGPGFLVNRLLLPYLSEALELILQGATIETIERVAEEFGMAKGPFSLMDEIGLDTTLHAGWSMAMAYPERISASPLLVSMIKSGRLGQKSGAGFFNYPDPASDAKSVTPDPAVIDIIAQWAKISSHFSADDVIFRLLLPMISEAIRILEEKKVRDPRDVDLGVIYGLGFPIRRGGLLWWANTIKSAMPAAILPSLDAIIPRLQPVPMIFDTASRDDGFTSALSP